MQPTFFTKMHGLGNDFIVLDCRATPFDWSATEIQALSNRHQGIGFDQLLIIENPTAEAVDFTYRIFNADGSEVEHCGNGARCFGKYLYDHHLFDFHRPAKVAVKRGMIEITRQGEHLYRVDMGVPNFTPFTQTQNSQLTQDIDGLSFGIVSMGNPHAVCEVDNIETAPVKEIGTALQQHPLFPEQVNVGFMQIIDRDQIHLRVFERGVGETQACGTGACAAVAVGIARGKLNHSVRVDLPGGTLIIDWAGVDQTLQMTGPATTVYTANLV